MANFQNRLSGFDLFMMFTPPFNFGDSNVDIVISDFWIVLSRESTRSNQL